MAKKSRNRSGVLFSEEEILALPLAELDAEIERCKIRRRINLNRMQNEHFDKRIKWLMKLRDGKLSP